MLMPKTLVRQNAKVQLRSLGSKHEIQTCVDEAGQMALPLAMTMRPTTSGGKPFATIQILPRAHVNRFFAATPCMPRTLVLNTEPYGSVYDDPP